MTRIVGIDIGFEKSCAVVLDMSDFDEMTATDFYESCDFVWLTSDCASLEKLLKLGDIFILEPTGSYSRLWTDNLEANGKEYRFVAHEVLSAWRVTCGWSDKDDEHDAVALAWYGASHLNKLYKFNKVRNPEFKQILEKVFTQKRLAEEFTLLCNQAKQLLHRECPEFIKPKYAIPKDGLCPYIWDFIANQGLELSGKRTKNKLLALQKVKETTIGSWGKKGYFSDELQNKARKLGELSVERHLLKLELTEFVYSESFYTYNRVFDKFEFGIFERTILLLQIYPFEQFLGDNGEEIRVVRKRGKKSKGGKLPKKRISYNRFHAAVGKAPNQRSSGKKSSTVVRGSSLCRSYLYLWANRCIFVNSQKVGTVLKNGIGTTLRSYYLEQIGKATETEKALNQALLIGGDDMFEVLKVSLGNIPGGSALISELKKVSAKFKGENLGKQAKEKGKTVLGNWAKARVCDKAVKMLFTELRQAFRNDKDV